MAYTYLFNQSKNNWDSGQFLQCEVNLGIPDTLKVFTVAPKPTVVSTHPVATPTPKPHCVGVNNNPWCYDFNLGNLIYTPPNGFCNYFNCIATFYAPDDPGDGYIVECSDATFSQSGGESGACSHHGSVMRPLYAH